MNHHILPLKVLFVEKYPDYKIVNLDALTYAGNLEKGVPACSACHSPKGLGNAPAAYPLLSGQQPEYVAKALKDYRSGERINEEPSKIMAAIAYKLDDAEIDALSSFVHGLY